MKKGLRVACSALTSTIYVGQVEKDGMTFKDGKEDVTSDVLKAVVDFVGPGTSKVIRSDGKPKYKITVEEIKE